MSRCAVNRWGPGTTCERPINTESSKDLQAKIAAMKAEREKQDTMWAQSGPDTKDTLKDNPKNISKINTKN
jgi:hypothetical protein